ncbi:MAG: hypothetical protein J3K34DRAFT_400147 [Monoraphidium minutum]|nr:MAG: hypothetical protein J3K34DRAFT_400147 [Monoraphidium minutum]
MGKTRGHGTRRGGAKGRPRGPKREGEEDSSSEDEVQAPRGLAGQAATVGMLPPSDSDSDEGEEGGEAKAAEAKAKPAGQSRNAGKLPPSGSEDEDEDGSDDESSDDDAPAPAQQAAAPRKKKDDDAPDPEQIRKDIERLEMIKNRREADRLKRIKDEGWDRFAPVSDTNKPPGSVPADHPSRAE